MDHFASMAAQKWALHFLYYQDMLERFANFLPEDAYGKSAATTDGTEGRRTIGDYLLEAAMQIIFSTGTTVEIHPLVEKNVTKTEVLTMLRKARQAFWKHAGGLSTEQVNKPRSTPLDDEDSTYVEEVVVLVGQTNRLLGFAMVIADLYGHSFIPSKLENFPSPYGPDEKVPGRDISPPVK